MIATRSRTPWSARALRLALAVLVGGTVFAPFAVAQQGTSAPPLCGKDRGGWESIDVPFTQGSQAITSWSISTTSTLMVATNGTVVMRSMDRGCSWTEAWRLDQIPAPGSTATSNESVIEQVHVSQSPLSVGKVFVTVDQLRPVSRPRVFASSDSGETFAPAERGLEGAIGRPEHLATAPSNPGKVYLLTDTSGVQRSLLPDGLPAELEGAKGVAQVLYESLDGGNTWGPMSAQTVYPGDPWNGIEVDPLDADRIWLFGDKGFQRAGDPAPVPSDPARPAAISDMDAWHLSGQPARVVATTTNAPNAYRSADGGQSYVVQGIPGAAQSVITMSPIQEVYATSTGVWVNVSGRRPISLTPADHRPILDLYLTDGAGSELWGRSETTIERKVFASPSRRTFDVCEDAADAGIVLPGCPHAETDFDVPCVETADVGEAALQPAAVDIALMPGESKTVRFDFDLPTSGEKMDVFFLIDISGSMQDAIDGTARAMNQIVTHLTNKGHDVHFGIGEYRSYDAPPAYRRVLDITNDCGAVEEALESLIASGGGQETQLEALYQVARGESRPGVNVVVPAGQNANFRPDAKSRIVIHTTDEAFSEGPPNPSYEEVETALDSQQIKQVGIAIESGFDTGGSTPLEEKRPPSEGLTEVARRTDAVAPEGGVDCNGDGHVDEGGDEPGDPPREPHEGEPVVCKISPLRVRSAAHMAPAIIEMLESQITPPEVCWDVPLDSAVIDDGPTDCVPPDLVGNPDAMGFELTLTCPQLQTRKKFSFDVGAEVDGTTDELSSVSVLCKVPAKPEPKDPPLTPFLPLPLAPFVPPPPGPPEIPPVPNPNPNPQPNPQSQAQAQAQAAMAHQEQQQPQLAYVYAQHEQAAAAAQESAGGKEAEYAMSSYSKDSRGVPPEAIFMIGAMTMSAAFGCLTLAREKVRVQHVRR